MAIPAKTSLDPILSLPLYGPPSLPSLPPFPTLMLPPLHLPFSSSFPPLHNAVGFTSFFLFSSSQNAHFPHLSLPPKVSLLYSSFLSLFLLSQSHLPFSSSFPPPHCSFTFLFPLLFLLLKCTVSLSFCPSKSQSPLSFFSFYFFPFPVHDLLYSSSSLSPLLPIQHTVFFTLLLLLFSLTSINSSLCPHSLLFLPPQCTSPFHSLLPHFLM